MAELAFDRFLKFKFRGIMMPVVRRRTSLAHDVTRQPIPYGRGAALDPASIGNRVFEYEIPASDGVDFEYRDLFTVTLLQMWEAVSDRSPGELIDPYEGAKTVRPLTAADELDPTRDRQGGMFTVSFEESKSIEELEGEINEDQSLAWAVDESVRLDEEMAAFDWQQPAPEQLTSRVMEWTQQEPPEPTVNPIDALTGALMQLDHALNRPQAILADAAFRLDKLDVAIDRVGDPKRTAAMQMSARRLHLAILRLLQQQQRGQRPMTAKVLPQPMTLFGAVRWLGTNVSEFLKLNPRLAKKPRLPQGTVVIAYK